MVLKALERCRIDGGLFLAKRGFIGLQRCVLKCLQILYVSFCGFGVIDLLHTLFLQFVRVWRITNFYFLDVHHFR